MSDANRSPITEARFRLAFADRALITRKAAAELLGIDEKTVTALVLAGALRGVNLGKQWRFSEAALREFIDSEGVPGRVAPSPPSPWPRFSERKRVTGGGGTQPSRARELVAELKRNRPRPKRRRSRDEDA